MALIELDIPEDEGWQDILAARVLTVVLAGAILRFGLWAWAAAAGDNGLVGAIPTFVAFVLGVELLVLAVADIDYRRWARPLGYATTVLLAALALAVVLLAEYNRLGTDLLAFTSYAVELIDAGVNPTAVSLAPAAALPGAPDVWTYRTDGSWATSWSYPTGTLWVYSLQYQLVGRWVGLRLTSLVGVVGLGWLITYLLPPEYGLLGPASLFLAQNEFLAALGGLNDMWYVLPTVATIWLWATERRVAAAAVFGIACSMKQQPWRGGVHRRRGGGVPPVPTAVDTQHARRVAPVGAGAAVGGQRGPAGVDGCRVGGAQPVGARRDRGAGDLRDLHLREHGAGDGGVLVLVRAPEVGRLVGPGSDPAVGAPKPAVVLSLVRPDRGRGPVRVARPAAWAGCR